MKRYPPATVQDETESLQDVEESEEAETQDNVIAIKEARLLKLQQSIRQMNEQICFKLLPNIKECRDIIKSAKKMAGELNGTIKQRK